MLAVALIPSAVLALSSAPEVVVRDGSGCVEAAAVAAAVEARLPESWRAEDAPALVLRLTVATGGDGEPRSLWIRLEVAGDAAGEGLVHREVEARRADCGALAELVAAVVARRLEGLPRQRWPEIGGGSGAPEPGEGGAGGPEAPAERGGGEAVAGLVDRRIGGGVSVSSGVDRPPAALGVEVRGEIGRRGGIGARLGAGGEVMLPRDLGPGSVAAVAFGVEAAATWEIGAGGGTRVVPALGARGGVAVARARGVEAPKTEAAPFARIGAWLGVRGRGGATAALGVEAAVLRVRLRDEASGAEALDPLVRIGFFAGYDVFFEGGGGGRERGE